MELFKVTCVTCEASLSVRNAGLVGQIVACPRCHSMVEVALPADGAPGTTTQPASSQPVGSELPQRTPTDFSSSEDGFDVDAGTTPPVVSDPSPESESGPSPNIASSGDNDSEFTAENLSAAEMAGEASAGVSMLTWSAASFFVGAAVTGLFLALRSEPGFTEHAGRNTVAAASSGDNTARDAVDPERPDVAGTAEHLPHEDRDAFDEQPEVEDDRATTQAQHDPGKPESAETPSLPELPRARPEDGGEEEETPGWSSKAAENAVSSSPDRKTASGHDQASNAVERKLVVEPANHSPTQRTFDPLEIDPERLALADLSRGESDSTLSASVMAADTVQPEIEPQVQDRPLQEPAVLELSREPHEGYRTPPAVEQLERVVPRLELRQLPLVEFLHLISSMAAVPISVAPEQLTMAGLTAGKRITVDVENSSFAEALSEALAPIHLEVDAEGPQVRIVRKEASKVRTINYPIDDLLDAEVSGQELASWIKQLIAPGSWEGSGGDGILHSDGASLRVVQSQTVQYELLIFLERIRLAQGKSLRSRYPERLLTRGPFLGAIAERMAAPTTFTFSHETRLAEVVRFWQSELGIPILVDWPALAAVEIWPQTRIKCAIANQPWQQALHSVLGPLQLDWRPVAGGAIQLTSAEVAESQPQLDLFPLNADAVEGVHGERTVARLRELVDAAGGGSADSPPGALVLDTANRMLYSRQPASVQKKIYEWLVKEGLLTAED